MVASFFAARVEVQILEVPILTFWKYLHPTPFGVKVCGYGLCSHAWRFPFVSASCVVVFSWTLPIALIIESWCVHS